MCSLCPVGLMFLCQSYCTDAASRGRQAGRQTMLLFFFFKECHRGGKESSL